MKPARAWVLLPSRRRLNLLDPDPASWTDRDLAIGLSRTFRWAGYSAWDFPRSVAQHSLTVLALRQAQQGPALTVAEARRELLHDATEALMGGWDPITPLKPHLGEGFRSLDARLQAAVDARYDLPPWTPESHRRHKTADRLASASEALHVAGWSRRELRDDLQITVEPLEEDPLAPAEPFRPWEPWPPAVAADRFLRTLTELFGGNSAAARASPEEDPTVPDSPTLVRVEGGGEEIEGRVVRGTRDEQGWDLDGTFTVETAEGDRFRVNGLCCSIEVLQ